MYVGVNRVVSSGPRSDRVRGAPGGVSAGLAAAASSLLRTAGFRPGLQRVGALLLNGCGPSARGCLETAQNRELCVAAGRVESPVRAHLQAEHLVLIEACRDPVAVEIARVGRILVKVLSPDLFVIEKARTSDDQHQGAEQRERAAEQGWDPLCQHRSTGLGGAPD